MVKKVKTVALEQQHMVETHKNHALEMIENTEDYRIHTMYELLRQPIKDTTKQQAIRYLLSYGDMLTKDMAKTIVAIANNMLIDPAVRDTVKVKIASDMKAFLGGTIKKKKVKTSFEELRKEVGFIEVEVPD